MLNNKEWRERQKNLNFEEYQKKELYSSLLNAHKKRQNQTALKAKHGEATTLARKQKRKRERK